MMRYHPFAMVGGLGWLLGLLFMIGLVLICVWIVNTIMGRPASRPGSPPAQPPVPPAGYPVAPAAPMRPTPNEILRERFARGEITAEEFQRARDVLGPDV